MSRVDAVFYLPSSPFCEDRLLQIIASKKVMPFTHQRFCIPVRSSTREYRSIWIVHPQGCLFPIIGPTLSEPLLDCNPAQSRLLRDT